MVVIGTQAGRISSAEQIVYDGANAEWKRGNAVVRSMTGGGGCPAMASPVHLRVIS